MEQYRRSFLTKLAVLFFGGSTAARGGNEERKIGGLKAGTDTELSASTGVLQVPSVSFLRITPKPNLKNGDSSIIEAASYHDGESNGGGVWQWHANDSRDDDGYVVINPKGNAGAGRWVAALGRAPSVARWGARGGGADDTAAIQKALDFGGPISLLDSHKITADLIMDGSRSTILGNGTSIDLGKNKIVMFSSLGPEAVAMNYIEGVFLHGTAVGFLLNSPGAAVFAGFTFRNGATSGFAEHFRVSTNSFNIKWDHWNMSGGGSTGLISVPGGAANYGEKLSLNQCQIYNADIAFNIKIPPCQVQVVACSLDYCDQYANVDAGWIEFTGCYFENSKDTKHWFRCGKAGTASISINGGWIAQNGPKIHYSIGHSEKEVSGGIRLSRVKLYNSTSVSRPYLIEGEGVSSTSQCVIDGWTDNKRTYLGSYYQNYCANGRFTKGLAGYSYGSSGQGGNPRIDPLSGFGAGATLKIQIAPDSGGSDQYVYWDVEAEATDNVAVAYMLKTSGLNNTNLFSCQIKAMGAGEIEIAAVGGSSVGVDIFNEEVPQFSQQRLAFIGLPPGTRSARIYFSTGGSSGNKSARWIYDVRISKL